MRLLLVTAPTEEFILPDELKAHPAARITAWDDDTWVNQLIIAARKRYEELTQRILMYSTWELYLDAFPSENYINLPGPTLAVTSIYYYNSSDALVELAATVYDKDIVSEPARVYLRYGQVWATTYAEPNAVVVRFVAGYTRANIPADLKGWLCCWIGAVYDGNQALQDIAESMMRTNGTWAI